jgi:ribonuclease MRP protein subunit RMP1
VQRIGVGPNPTLPSDCLVIRTSQFDEPTSMYDAFPNPKAIETLQLELSLLRILHHRNKNQHHLQPFFKHLSILKRILSLLLTNVESEYLLQRLRTIVVPTAWEEFSRVVARGEYVTLGLVLCGCVSRIGYCVGGIVGVEDAEPIVEVDEIGVEKNDELGELIMRDIFVEDSAALENFVAESEVHSPSMPTSPRIEGDKTGHKERKEEENLMKTPIRVSEKSGIGEIQPPAKRRKKKKTQQDDIDRLFAGFD